MAFRERALAQKTLVCLLQSLEGKEATVEFRDETVVQGRIDQVDGYMNIDMSDVTYTAPSGMTGKFARYACQGKFVRYVQLPQEFNAKESILDRLSALAAMPVGRGRGRGRGGFRGGRGRGGRGGGFRSRGGPPRYGGGGSSRDTDRYSRGRRY